MAGEDQLPAPAQAKDGEEGACGEKPVSPQPGLPATAENHPRSGEKESIEHLRRVCEAFGK